jgi:cytochrome c-type biogenesis protein CcmH/NrfG
MLLAIVLNLVFIVVIVGGWSYVVWAVYKRLDDPYQAQENQRLFGADPFPAADDVRETVLPRKRAA